MMRFARAIIYAAILSLIPAKAVSEAFSEAAFPLRIAAGERYVEDARGRPFLIHGDTAWSLIAELTREETELYLSDRRQRGFNALVVSLIEHSFTTNAPANAYGEVPFMEEGRFDRPNDRYFDHAEWVLQRAEELGFLVLLAPAYLGIGGGGEGWYAKMEAAGTEALLFYGRYLGRRFGRFDNVLWLHGGDYDAEDKELVRAVVNGLAAEETGGLQTFHSARETITIEHWRGEAWLDLDTVYTYEDVYQRVLERYVREDAKPLLMLEAKYENEHDSTTQSLRATAYGALIAGAAGHIFGNNPIWHFSGPGLHPVAVTWQEALASPGAQSMSHVRRLFESLDWWTLEPDVGGLVRPASEGRVVAAVAPDRRLAVAYASGGAEVVFDLPDPGEAGFDLVWFDPASGERIAGGHHAPASALSPPSHRNSAGDDDWVLLLRRVQ